MVYLRLIFVMMFWGGTFIATRIATQAVGPFTGAMGRFMVASICLLVAVPLIEKKFPRLTRKEFLIVLGMALTGIIGYNVFFFLGLREVEASRAALIIALNPVGIMLFSTLIFGEKYPRMAYAGIAMSFLGAAIVITKGDLLNIGMHYGTGELFISGCVVMWVTYTFIGRQAVKTLSPLVSTAYACCLGFLGLLIPAVIWELPTWAPLSVPVATSLIYLGVFGTALGFLWYYDALRVIGPTSSGIFINLVPIFAVILGVIFLKETVTWPIISGGALVITGVIVTNMAQRRHNRLKGVFNQPILTNASAE